MTRNTLAAAFAIMLTLVVGSVDGHAFSLDEIERDVAEDYPEILHAPSLPESSNDVLLLDVREQDEYAVSHIPGAVRVDPGIGKTRFLAMYREKLKGKKLVFYCSVGVRSSILASRVRGGALKAGATQVQNLTGGIFRWHNARKSLVSRGGVTDYVHPYNRRWGQLVKRRELTRYRPGP